MSGNPELKDSSGYSEEFKLECVLFYNDSTKQIVVYEHNRLELSPWQICKIDLTLT